MAALNENSEDIRKLHAEVTQLVNQRVLLAILATTIVGATIGWAIPKETTPTGSPNSLPYIASMTLITVLCSIGLVSHFLRRQLRTVTIYLEIFCGSPWEKHWKLYRTQFSYSGYSKPIAYHLIAMGLISLFFPYLLIQSPLKSGVPTWAVLGPPILFTIFALTTYFLGISSGEAEDEKCRENWSAIKAQQSVDRQSGEA